MIGFECLIAGDSIAVGISAYLPKCHVQTVVGINTNDWLRKFQSSPKTNKVLLSLGSNDLNLNSPAFTIRQFNRNKLLADLKSLRARYNGSKVYWVLPSNNNAAVEIIKLCAYPDDVLLNITQVSSDLVHPTPNEYRRLSNRF